MEENQNIVYISKDTTQCPNCFGQIESKDKKRGTFFCLYCGQKLTIGAVTAPQPNSPVREQEPYAQQSYAQQPPAQQSYAQQPPAQQSYAQQPPAQQSYAQQPSAQQPYAPQQPAQQSYAPQPSAPTNFEGQNRSAGGSSDFRGFQSNPVPEVKKSKPVPVRKKAGIFEILSVIFGALSIFVCCCYGSGIVFGALSIVFALLDIKKRKTMNSSHSALDMVGLVLGIIGTVLSLIMAVWLIGARITGGSSPMDTIRQSEKTETTASGIPTSAGIKDTSGQSVTGNEKNTASSEEKPKAEPESKVSKSEETVTETDTSKKSETDKPEEKPEKESVEKETGGSEKEQEKETSEKKEAAVDPNEIRPEIKDAIDGYEDFMDGYIDFMQKYSTSNSTELLMDYMDWMSKYADMVEKMDKLEGDLTEAEMKYYNEVLARISAKMLEYSITQ